MKKILSPKYNASEVELGKYARWVEQGLFKAGDTSKPAFSIVIPPPNVTGKLHLGHAWDTTLQDMIIRFKRMTGYDALWLPGMDHAGIATQAKVEERLRKQGKSRYDLGREKFLEVAWEWKKEYADIIRAQWAKLGLSLDYSRERFTLDEGLSDAVKTVFVELYNKGLIYRGERIIHWDPVQKTALSDIEVIHKEKESLMYYFKYVRVGHPSEHLVVATTRPETMFGDVCVVVNPDDERYQHWIGAEVINPANGIHLPVISDNYVDKQFGTGAMKCTPAHDANDFLIGEKYHFPKLICMNPDATLNSLAGPYCGLDRFVARDKMVEDMKTKGLVVKIEKHLNQVAHSERSDAVVEPYLSKQWFVKMGPLAEQALALQESESSVKFFPDRFEKTFTGWMENIQDWCISRQLWWGHRIPAWYHQQTGEVYVGVTAPGPSHEWKQDDDVLDTWFSSALWPFSTFGWPAKTDDFHRYFPTNVLVTGYDIIFFWVARMIFQSKEFTQLPPFKHVLIHGLIRDEQGRKMSKSLGNGIDPMAVIEQYGADTLRFFLTTNSAPGLDLRYQPEKVDASWNFINKIWNAARFVLMNLPENYELKAPSIESLSAPSTWILKRLNETIQAVEYNMEKYEFVVVGNYLYSFIWDDFCSWYIELAKVGLTSEVANERESTQATLGFVLDAISRLIHPFMPFVSEEIFQSLHGDEQSIVTASWPRALAGLENVEMKSIASLLSIISTVRTFRSEHQISYKQPVKLFLSVVDSNQLKDLKNLQNYIDRFTNPEECLYLPSLSHLKGGHHVIGEGIEIYVSYDEHINKADEILRLKDEVFKLSEEVSRCEKMLSSPSFLTKAPATKVESEKTKLSDYQQRLNVATHRLQELEQKS